jgi:hypothetical protein
MNANITRRNLLLAMLAGVAGRTLHAAQPAAAPSTLILCGAAEVFMLELRMDAEIATRKVWSWRAAECPDIPDALKSAFRSTDDCKPVEGGRKILISSSSGAVALVERASRRALFYAKVPNAHSIELLPGGRIATAASGSNAPGGNRITIFDIATRRVLAADALKYAHGVVWDEKRGLLWALGNDTLRAYRLEERSGGGATLKVEFQMTLPENNGHDLVPLGATPGLFISTGKRCWVFDRDARRITPHGTMANLEKIKSFSVHPVTGQIVYMQAEGKNWWSEHVHFLNPKATLRLHGAKLYKARWLVEQA